MLTWLAQIGGTGSDFSTASTVDADGNTYITGRFTETADFDPGPGVFNLTAAAGDQDGFVAKYDSSGALLWARKFGGDTGNSFAEDDDGRGISVDASGIYVTGQFVGSADFTGDGVADLTSAGNADIFVLKLDQNGNTLWFKGMGSSSPDVGRAIAVAGGFVYVTGEFSGTVDFDPGPGISNLRATGAKGKGGNVGSDGFVLKLDTSGNYVHAWNFGGTSIDAGRHIVVDDATNTLFLDGSFVETADFDPSSNTVNRTSAGLSDRFFASYSTSGGLNWVQSIGNADNDWANTGGVAVDASYLYLLDQYAGSLDVDPSSEVLNLTSTGDRSSFLVRYSRLDGQLDPTFSPKQLGGSTSNDAAWPNSLALDESGTIFVSGWYTGTVDLDPGTGTTYLPVGSGDGFLLKLDAAGNYLNHWHIDTQDNYVVLSYVAGVVGDTIFATGAIGPGTSTFPSGQSIVGFGKEDVFIFALDQTPTNASPVANADTDSTFEGVAVTTNVLANDVLGNPPTVITAATDGADGGVTFDAGAGTTTYTPNPGFIGTDQYAYTITANDGETSTATVTVTVSNQITTNAIYVWDISFESRQRGPNTDYRIVVYVLHDSDFDGVAEATDDSIAGVAVTVSFTDALGNEQTYSGVTDASGIFRSQWIKGLGSGTHRAEVTDLALAGFAWDPDAVLDSTLNDQDDDADGLPDELLTI